ncbi:MAG: PAS domain S-box protein [Syntrophobacteraceae bacterium]
MSLGSLRLKTSGRIVLSFGFVFAVAAFVLVIAGRGELRLSAVYLCVLASLFLVHHFLMKRLLLGPLRKIHDQALRLAASDEHLGEMIPLPPGGELAEVTDAFNRMSQKLKDRVSSRRAAEEELQRALDLLETRVAQRDSEVSSVYEQCRVEVQEKNRVQDALIQERDFIESLVNTAQAIILVLDGQGRIVRFNPYLEKLSGYKLEEVAGQDWFYIFLPPDCRAKDRGVFSQTMSGRQVRGYVSTIRTKGGQERQIEWYNDELTRPDGSRIGLLSVGQDITKRRKAEEELQKSEMRLRNLYSQLLRAQEEERRRISKEVHDSIGSPLAGIKIGLENAFLLDKKGTMEAQSLRALIDLTQHVMRECRRIMTDLRPPVLDDYGIVAAIRWSCERFQMINPGIKIDRQIEVSENDIPASLRIVLFRIVQEALNNAAIHSGAKMITISLFKENQIELRIHDDGCGFNMNSVLSRKAGQGGFGISNMQERVELSGGSFEIETDVEKGTTVCARWSM